MLKMSQGARKTQEINKKGLNKKDSNPINYKNADCDGITWNGNNIQENPLRAYLGISISTLYDLDLHQAPTMLKDMYGSDIKMYLNG